MCGGWKALAGALDGGTETAYVLTHSPRCPLPEHSQPDCYRRGHRRRTIHLPRLQPAERGDVVLFLPLAHRCVVLSVHATGVDSQSRPPDAVPARAGVPDPTGVRSGSADPEPPGIFRSTTHRRARARLRVVADRFVLLVRARRHRSRSRAATGDERQYEHSGAKLARHGAVRVPDGGGAAPHAGPGGTGTGREAAGTDRTGAGHRDRRRATSTDDEREPCVTGCREVLGGARAGDAVPRGRADRSGDDRVAALRRPDRRSGRRDAVHAAPVHRVQHRSVPPRPAHRVPRLGGVLLSSADNRRVAARSGRRHVGLSGAVVPVVVRLLQPARGEPVRLGVPHRDHRECGVTALGAVDRSVGDESGDGARARRLEAVDRTEHREHLERYALGLPAAAVRAVRRVPRRRDGVAEPEEPVAPPGAVRGGADRGAVLARRPRRHVRVVVSAAIAPDGVPSDSNGRGTAADCAR